MNSFFKKQDSGFSAVELIVVLAVLASLVGLGTYAYKNTTKKKDAPLASQSVETEVKNESPLATDLTALKSVSEIHTIATQSIKPSDIVSIELGDENGVLVYKVKLSSKTAIFYNAKTGAVVTKTQLTSVDDEGEGQGLPETVTTVVTSSQARDIAQAEFPTKTFKKIEIQTEDGVLVYSVRFTDGSRIDIDAQTSAIVRKKDKTDKQAEKSSETPTSNTDSNKPKTESETEKSNDDSKKPTTSAPAANAVTQEQARTTAQNARPGKTISKVEVESENGTQVYSFRFSDSGRVDVRASDGAVVRNEN